MKVKSLDHIVLTVADIETTVSFYVSVLGMAREEFENGRIALKFGKQKINLHQYKKEFDPKAKMPTPGSEDLCFITEENLESALSHVQSHGVEIIEGPVKRTGAIGKILSFYFRDLDGNLIEVSNYQMSA